MSSNTKIVVYKDNSHQIALDKEDILPILEALIKPVPNPLKSDVLTPLFCLFDLQVNYDVNANKLDFNLNVVQNPYLLQTGETIDINDVLTLPPLASLEHNPYVRDFIVSRDLLEPEIWLEFFFEELDYIAAKNKEQGQSNGVSFSREQLLNHCFSLPNNLIKNPDVLLKMTQYMCQNYIGLQDLSYIKWEVQSFSLNMENVIRELTFKLLFKFTNNDLPKLYLPSNIEIKNKIDCTSGEPIKSIIELAPSFKTLFQPLQIFKRLLECADKEYSTFGCDYIGTLVEQKDTSYLLSEAASARCIRFATWLDENFYMKGSHQAWLPPLRLNYDYYSDRWFLSRE